MSFRILTVGPLRNTMAGSWLLGLRGRGHRVVAATSQPLPSDPEDIARHYALPRDERIVRLNRPVGPDFRDDVTAQLDGLPDLIVSWWGSSGLNDALGAKSVFPSARLAYCVDTLPNASNSLTELREAIQFLVSDKGVDGYIFYSEQMAGLFRARVPGARRKPHLATVFPYPLSAYVPEQAGEQAGAPELQRLSPAPHVVSTGRSDQLWSSDRRMDALGSFLTDLAARDVEVFVPVPRGSHPRDLSYVPPPPGSSGVSLGPLHTYPRFSNQELMCGRMATHLDQYDAHLAIYNEYNATLRRRVSTGLATRMSFGMTFTTPLAVTTRSTFTASLWATHPFGFQFETVEDLAEKLHDRPLLEQLRATMKQVHRSFSFEGQAPRIEAFLSRLVSG